ncbi:MAG TPA: His/Gly/Thr/Pro-type tRNA ligase C-terminal domain-containing protein, partial [Chitinophagales bacterium]|nr:His/Gly/Thr/Pro-type tRNA ligase C-terminal domain-containing protein [Chitinophagales bacterium]
GHTAHATKQEAISETIQMINVYADFAENYMALPVIKGVKSESERFAGAEDTYTIEAMMQDGKALQSGTSHFLGQNFAKAFEVTFKNKENEEEYVWATSWGVSTRLIGALIMAHADDDGLVLPPRIAPYQVVIIPFLSKNMEETNSMIGKANELKADLAKMGIRAMVDSDETKRPGFKFAEYELKGVPLRIVIGPRDLANGMVEMARRDTKEKSQIPVENLSDTIANLLEDIQLNMFNKAKSFRDSKITKVEDFETFQKVLDEKSGFVLAHWDGTAETEEKIKELTKATIRCIPLDNPLEDGKCVLTGKPSKERVLFARAY